MLGQVDVEVDGGVEDSEEVGYLAHVLHPGRPGHILLSKILNMGQSYKEISSHPIFLSLCKLPQIGDPSNSMAHNKHYNQERLEISIAA